MNLFDFAKAKLAYGPEAIAADHELAIRLQEVLIWLEFLAPPADGQFGPITASALWAFQQQLSPGRPELTQENGFLGPVTAQALLETNPCAIAKPRLNLGDDLASRIVKYMLQHNQQIAIAQQEYNIVYIEGMNPDGSLNDRSSPSFNDLRIVIEFHHHQPAIVGCWPATTAYGEQSAAPSVTEVEVTQQRIISLGQYKAWQIGALGSAECYQGLIQTQPILRRVTDQGQRQSMGDHHHWGIFGLHQQHGYDLPRTDIPNQSQGCLVGQSRQGHEAFMALIKQDRRYQLNHRFHFRTTIMSGAELNRQFPPQLTPANSMGQKISLTTILPSSCIINHSTSHLDNQAEHKPLSELLSIGNTEIEIPPEQISKMSTRQQLDLVKKYLEAVLVSCSKMRNFSIKSL